MAITPPSNLNPDSAPWGRWVADAIRGAADDNYRFKQDQTVTNKMLNSSINTLTAQINRAPLGVSGTVNASNGLAPGSSTLTQMANIVFDIPNGKSKASVFAIANAQYLDLTSGGLAFAEGRVGIRMGNTIAGNYSAWTYSILARGAKDAGASAVINVLTPALSAQYDTAGFNVLEVMFEASVSNTSAFSGSSNSNQTQLSTTVTFTA